MIVRRSGYQDLDNGRDLYDDVNFNEDKSYHPQNTLTHTHCTLDVQWRDIKFNISHTDNADILNGLSLEW